MTFAELINRLLALRLNIREPYWLEFKLGRSDTFSVSIGYPGFRDYKNRTLVYKTKLGRKDPVEIWETVNNFCRYHGLINKQKDLFDQEQSNQ